MKRSGVKTISDSQNVYFEDFEDNYGAFNLVWMTKLLPHTKHINVAYQHFRTFFRDKIISSFLDLCGTSDRGHIYQAVTA